jgi:hypothetical protein
VEALIMCKECRATEAGQQAERNLKQALLETSQAGLNPSEAVRVPLTTDQVETVGGFKRSANPNVAYTPAQGRLIRRAQDAMKEVRRVHDEFVMEGLRSAGRTGAVLIHLDGRDGTSETIIADCNQSPDPS